MRTCHTTSVVCRARVWGLEKQLQTSVDGNTARHGLWLQPVPQRKSTPLGLYAGLVVWWLLAVALLATQLLGACNTHD
jgi:hypothetical protein